MTTWIIAYNKDGNTSMLKIDSEHQPDIDDAVELVTRKAEELYPDQESEHEHDPDLEDTLRHTPCRTLRHHHHRYIPGLTGAECATGHTSIPTRFASCLRLPPSSCR